MEGDKLRKFMLEGVKLAGKGTGKVSPNPMVGAVLVKNGKIVGRGWHDHFGGKHAEVNAIENAGRKARGATLFVTLEPCNHYGKRPPCTEAIIEACIKEVHIATLDPNRGSRQGARELQRKGIKVHTGLCRQEAEKQNEFYIRSLRYHRPFIALKTAMTSDGFISYGSMRGKRITGKRAFEFTQGLRAKHDAVLVGVNTVIKDDPLLNVRKRQELNPIRVVLDSRGKTPLSSRVLREKRGETLIVCTKKTSPKKIKAFASRGATVVIARSSRQGVDIAWLMKKLCKLGVHSVLMEGGNRISTSFLQHKLFDRIYLLVAPRQIKNGLKAFSLKKSIAVKITEKKKLGKDLLLVMEKK